MTRSWPNELDPDPEGWDFHGPQGSGLEVLAEYERWATSQLEEAGLPVDARKADHILSRRAVELSKPLGEPVPVGARLSAVEPSDHRRWPAQWNVSEERMSLKSPCP